MIRQAGAVLALAFGLLAAPMAAQTAETVAVLDVHNAYCDLCPSIVTSALRGVEGVKAVDVGKPNSNGEMMAKVVFDASSTKPADLIKATTDHGYPAQIVEQTPAGTEPPKPTP